MKDSRWLKKKANKRICHRCHKTTGTTAVVCETCKVVIKAFEKVAATQEARKRWGV